VPLLYMKYPTPNGTFTLYELSDPKWYPFFRMFNLLNDTISRSVNRTISQNYNMKNE
jgi:hypothetical protein